MHDEIHQIDTKNSVKPNGNGRTKPNWLKVKQPGGNSYAGLKRMMLSKTLHTVCEEAKCPNIAECWERGTATFMILGDTCTRSCGFCNVNTGKPNEIDPFEPAKVAWSVNQMGVHHVVITSVNRDELKYQGSDLWARTIRQVKKHNPGVTIEVLIPDFKGDLDCLQRVIDEKPNVLNHNVETVPRLYRPVRPQAKYERSLLVLEESKKRGMRTKTGIMVGLGEKSEEVIDVMKALRAIDVDIFTVGQYLQPTEDHLPLDRYVHPEEFEEYRRIGLDMGFRFVESGPLVRSSYRAEKHVK